MNHIHHCTSTAPTQENATSEQLKQVVLRGSFFFCTYLTAIAYSNHAETNYCNVSWSHLSLLLLVGIINSHFDMAVSIFTIACSPPLLKGNKKHDASHYFMVSNALLELLNNTFIKSIKLSSFLPSTRALLNHLWQWKQDFKPFLKHHDGVVWKSTHLRTPRLKIP